MSVKKIIHLSTRDAGGGAGIAASRMHRALLNAGHNSELWVAQRSGHLPSTRVIAQGLITDLRRFAALRRETKLRNRYQSCASEILSFNFAPDTVIKRVAAQRPDVVLVHWTGNSFIRPESLKQLSCPVIQVLHDMWPITGMEHYTEDTQALLTGEPDPAISESVAFCKLSRQMMLRKRQAYEQVGRLGFWADGRWLADLAADAFVANGRPSGHFVYPIDTEAFRMIPRSVAREVLGLPQDAKLILASADSLDNPRKGADCLLAALKIAVEGGNEWGCVCLGNGGQVFAEQAGLQVHRMGYLSDPLSLSLVYSAVDVTATPSRQEAFGQVCQESLVCGTPVVAFATGGHAEQIVHEETGYLAQCFDVADLADGLAWAIATGGDEASRTHIRESACQQAAPQQFMKQFEHLLGQLS